MTRFNFIFVAFLAAVATIGLALPAYAETLPLLCDFEGTTACYDNNTTQTTGHWRDTYLNSSINLSNNGTANDYLVMGLKSGAIPPCTVYDTTPNTTSPYSLFTVAKDATWTATVDVAFPNWGIGYFGIFDPLATATTVRGISMGYFNNPTGTNDKIRFYSFKDENFDGNNIGVFQPDYNVLPNNTHYNAVRLSLSLTNNGTTGTLGFRADAITALEGTVTGNIYDNSITFTYGTGSGQLNFDPVNHGFEILLSRHTGSSGTSVYFDRVTSNYVPEPSAFALLACGLVGLLAYAWRKRK